MVVAAILAAGAGQRFGTDKTRLLLGGKPLWRWSYDVLCAHPNIDRVILVGSPDNIADLAALGEARLGGSTRQESSRIAAEACAPDDLLLVHDAARPFLSPAIIDRVLATLRCADAVAVSMPVTDTIKRIDGDSITTLDRSQLRAMQTPQGSKVSLLLQAHRVANQEFTDEMALLESIGIVPVMVDGEASNFKVTTPEDFDRAQRMISANETRTGIGYDIHAFSDDETRELWLGGVKFPGHRALHGHSDADVLLHAVADALLGAAALGDIGQHFPNTDPRWAGEPSLTFLSAAKVLLDQQGWTVQNVDATVIAETPKVMARAADMRAAIAASLEIEIERVSIKATTNEGLGSIGRSEGISAFATATIRR